MNNRNLAHVIGYATLVCLGIVGAAQALPNNSVDSFDIINGEVKRPDLAADAVNSAKVADGTLTAADLLDGTLTGADVSDGSLTGADLSDGSLTGADVSDGALTGADLATNTLNGQQIAESNLNFAFNCGAGLIKAQALVQNAATIPDTPTDSATYLWYKRTCAGAMDIERLGVGVYRVRIFATGASVVQVTPYNSSNNSASVSLFGFFHDGDGGLQFNVVIRDVVSGAAEDGSFALLGY